VFVNLFNGQRGYIQIDRQTAATKGIKTCIPARTNRTTAVPFSATVYRRRHRVENFFERIKRYRRVATRYDKLAETFFVFVCLAILFTLRLT
jgi:transposase